ncbi:MAG TPA: peptidylprolyl isomerase [Vicinamibacterales bacterium]|nr:peptidylprolyl isomerase [Vicinamibacterales bacterium]
MWTLFLVLSALVQAPRPAPAPAPATPPAAATAALPVVVVETSLGSITIELYPDKAPDTVDNFLQYVKDGFYDGTIFHRVVPGYVIQGGGYTPDLAEKPTRPPVRNEATNGLSNARGTVAMARTRLVRSATSQFFINLADNAAQLDFHGYGPGQFGYAVFGRVIAGMDVVDRIAAQPTQTTSEGMESVPVTPIVIRHITVKTP